MWSRHVPNDKQVKIYVQKRKVFDRRKSAESFCATDYIFNTFWSFEYNVILRALRPYQKFISKPHLQRAGVRFFQSDNEEDEDEEEEGEDTEAVITVPPTVKVDKECWTHEPEFDKYVLYSTKTSVLSSFFWSPGLALSCGSNTSFVFLYCMIVLMISLLVWDKTSPFPLP